MTNLRDFRLAKDRREFIEKKLKTDLKYISSFQFTEEEVTGKNIENLIGATSIPLGIAGPLKINKKEYLIPLATTEGALVASISRGCKAITLSGGAQAEVHNSGVTRSPVFKTKGVSDAVRIKKWLGKNYKQIAKLCESTSSHLKLLKIDSNFAGKNLFIRFSFDSDDAMGMNMATIAVQNAVSYIEKSTSAECISISGNYEMDKKPSWLNFIEGRGKMVWAECTISREIVKDTLKTTPEKITEVLNRKILIGSAMSGSIGFNAHFANIIAAIFASTGQDLGQIVEGSLGITSAEITEKGDLYFSVYLPSLMVGTVGGGTNLPSQRTALNIIGTRDVLEFSKVVAAAVLGGELSLLSSLSEGTLAKAHIKLGRKNIK